MKKKITSAKKHKELRRRRNVNFFNDKEVMKLDDYLKLARSRKSVSNTISNIDIKPNVTSTPVVS